MFVYWMPLAMFFCRIVQSVLRSWALMKPWMTCLSSDDSFLNTPDFANPTLRTMSRIFCDPCVWKTALA